MAVDDTGTSHAAERAVWYHDLDRALSGEQPLGWPTWAAPIYTSQCLTAEGLRVAEWAVGVLRGFLGDDFLQRVVDARVVHALLSPSLWPLFEGRRLYVDLFRLAAQIALLGDRCLPLQTAMRNVANPSNWTHALTQLEIAGLGLTDGWQATFETDLGKGYPVDVRLDKGAETLLLEIATIGMAQQEWEADQFSQGVTMAVLGIELRYGVHVSGFLGEPAPEDITTQWLQEIEAAADATARDGGDRWVLGGVEGKVRVTTKELELNETHLEGAPVITDAWGRLDLRIKGKARQTATAGRVWIWLEDHAGLFFFTPVARMSLAERFASLAPRLREALEPYPHVAGIILTPGRIWAESAMQDETCGLPSFEGAVTLRRLLPVAYARETVIVAHSGVPDDGWMAFRDWYGREASWLDWALERLGKPPLDALVHESLGTTEQH